ncbi:uncharacterized protein LOC132722574 [Ruditapes philippinarum]|uniref:uncharacterized protein LOC132722574 n=1 Tax=Ruditapes philippinarum TaxID=129788 RepID=UPI00295AE84A|nr:uncharacterized protein LOC132722574 [Ruditapes philippinarum]
MSKEEDVSHLVDNDELARELQPHLNYAASNPHDEVSLDNVTPTVEGNREPNGGDTGTRNADGNSSAENKDATGSANTCNQNGEVALSSTPVYYSSSTGESNIVNEPVVIRQANGVHVIRTRECCHTPNNYSREKPLKLKHIRILKAFSTVAVVIFFPLGIPAMYYAFKSEKEFHAGILRGDLDLARKFAKRSERLIIFSVMGALLVAVGVFAFVERKLMEDDDDYWKYRNNNRVLPSG